MRHADDIADLGELPVEDRRQKLADWLEQARRVFAGEPTDDAVLLALADSRRRFAIPADLFEKLVQGTAMDLQAAGEISYPTFQDLYAYCYHVASVVGVVCIHIFGYRDPRAEWLAERCGIAFQLTNILRDLKEDAAAGRIYLPLEDFTRFNLSPEHLRAMPVNGSQATALRPLLEFEVNRAREFYQSGRELIPLVDEDSRPALWVLIEIYNRLLGRIAERNYDVFSERIRLSSTEKFAVLGRGLWRRLTA
jgi:phytoene synthase